MRRGILPSAEGLVVLAACMVGVLVAQVPTPRDMRGPFPILSVPYHADGAVDYEVLAKDVYAEFRRGQYHQSGRIAAE